MIKARGCEQQKHPQNRVCLNRNPEKKTHAERRMTLKRFVIRDRKLSESRRFHLGSLTNGKADLKLDSLSFLTLITKLESFDRHSAWFFFFFRFPGPMQTPQNIRAGYDYNLALQNVQCLILGPMNLYVQKRNCTPHARFLLSRVSDIRK